MSMGTGGVPARGSKALPALALTILYWLSPALLCLVLYREGITAWFQTDDFAWLSLRRQVHNWRDLATALFAPMAQGTIRPWSERGFFLLFEWLFGFDALPFRICAFLTQFVNLILLAAIGRRVTGSPAAGWLAAGLWTINAALALPMICSSVYNQILSGFFLLAAFWFLLRYIESGRQRDNVGQWTMFLLGFGALEVNVVYPALAAAYTFLFARKYFRGTLAMFVPAAGFIAIDRLAASHHAIGPYALHFDRILPLTFLGYWRQALVPDIVPWMDRALAMFLVWALSIALIGFTAIRAIRKDFLPLFCLAWFAIVIAPFVPLRDHITQYYVMLPAIGLAILAAYALICAWRRSWFWKVTACVVALGYAAPMIDTGRRVSVWWADQSLDAKRLVLGVARARELHPGKVILLEGLAPATYDAAVSHRPFQVFGISDVYLAPGSVDRIRPYSLNRWQPELELASGPTLNGLHRDQVEVYSVGGPRLKNITTAYEERAAATLSPSPPRRVVAGMPLMAYLLGPEWYPVESGHRWMPKRATLRMGGPLTSGDKLYLEGACPDAQFVHGPLQVHVTVDGIPLPEARIMPGIARFSLSFALPNQLVGRESVLVSVESGRTFNVSNDIRELSLAFGIFEIR